MRRPAALLPLLAAAFLAALLAVPASAAAPTATGLPAITGNARQGQLLTSTTGTFTGTAPIAYGRAWLRCDETGAACVPIAGAGAATYTLAAADVGRTIRVTVTATNLEGSASATSPATAVVGPLQPPVNDGAPPLVSGTMRDGQALGHTTGGWSGIAPITFTRSWRRCDAGGASCTAISGASAASYTLTSTDVGATIRVEVTARNADGEGVATSAQTAVVDPAPPLHTALPAVSGTARSGQTLTNTAPGTWTGTVPITYARQWNRCDVAGSNCTAIPGAIASTYVLTDADVGSTIRLAVTATNVAASATASSAATATVGPKVPPVNTVAPSIGGSAIDGQLLTAADGTWTGTATITTTRRWQRCAPAGVDCADLAATGTTLTLTAADVGSVFRTRVTATNPDGSTQIHSALTPVVAPAIPASTAAPVISGTAREGQLLSATPGTWKGTPTITYAYSWQRCPLGVCSTIAGATAPTYRVAAADVGAPLRVTVTATNAAGTTAAQSAATATVLGGVPVSVDPPELSGALPRDGELYSSTLGTWAGTATIVHDRQWLRCNSSGASCTPLIGEVSATYRLGPADLGKTVRLEVTATNAFGATKAQSPASPVILAAPPQSAGDPVITGLLRDDQDLTAVSSWTGTAPITLTYQWQRCEAAVDVCTDIAGATAVTHRLTATDVGARIRVRVGALNAGGGGSATSALAAVGDPAGVVAPAAPQAATAPALSGTAIEGSVLTSGPGSFTGTSPMTRSYRWQRCDSGGGGCADIAGATAAQITLGAADRGFTVRAIVTATNASGSDSIASAPSAVVVMAPPSNVVAPAVTPDTGLRDGATLVGTDGGWAGSQPMTLAYRWQRCTSTSPADCVFVPGAAGPTYMLTVTDVGFRFRLLVSASNGAGTTTQSSEPTAVVGTNPPISILPPTVTGIARDGDVLTAVDGTWTGPVVVQTDYEWWRCDTAGANCTIVPGANAQSLVLVSADVGLTLRARVIRTSEGGTTGAFSEQTAPVAPAPPQSLTAPQVGGPTAVGKLLSAENGTWSGTPALSFAHQWRRCDADGANCADIAAADGATYRAAEADAGARLRVVVTATNAVGTASATSAASPVVQIDPPVIVDLPRIEAPAGPIAAGITLTAQPGTWDGAQPIDFAFAWARCDATLTTCATIAGATADTYTLVAADIGARIVVRVTATNVVDTATERSDGTPAVLPEAPSVVGLPAVTAASGVRDGAKLVASSGTWNGATPMTYAISWLRCDADGTNCGAVPGASGANYTLTGDDVGHAMRARVAASNITAEVAADSAPTVAVAPAPPVSTAAPAVVALADKPVVGSALRAQTGTWGGTAPIALAIRWQRCPATSLACDDIPGATGTEYTITAADAGRRLRIVVTASNGAPGSVSATSPPSVVVPAVVTSPAPGTATTSATGTTATGTGTGTTATATKKGTTSGTQAGATSSPTRSIAAVQRLKLTADGRLRVTLRCPTRRVRTCRAVGTIVGGTSLGELIPKTSLHFTVRSATVRRGRPLVRYHTLTAAQLAELARRRDVNFRVRLAYPGRTTRFREVYVRTYVPRELRAQAG